MNANTALFNTANAPALVSPTGPGAISGGLLRPGAIDQAAFAQELQAQQAAREAAGAGGRPVAMPIPSSQDGIPTLTSAQFAALVGAQETTSPAPSNPVPAAAIEPAAAPVPTAAPTAAFKLSGVSTNRGNAGAAPGLRQKPTGEASSTPASAGQQVAVQPSTGATDGEDVPAFARSAASTTPGTQVAAAATEGDAAAEAKASTAPADPKLVHLKDPPDKEKQKELRMQGKRWVVDETPGSRELFFGPDGEFGWDDFLDLINPLQHIPGVAQIYRAVTGDQAYGASQLIGGIPFGPLGGVSMIGTVAELAVTDVTGKDIGDNLVAMIFGTGDAGAPVPGDMAEAAPAASGTVQSATLGASYDLDAASQRHEDCRA